MIPALLALLRRSTPCTPRACSGCGSVVTRLTPAQAAQAGSKILPHCRRSSCTGRLYLAPPETTDRLIDDLNENGAPVAPGAPPNTAAPLGGTTAMAHTLQSETTPRGRQMAAALALAHLLESGPAIDCTWRINQDGGLNGNVVETERGPRGDARARAGVAAFAEFLGVEMKRSQGRTQHAEWLTLSAVGQYRDRPLTVWTHVDVRPVSPYASFEGRRA